VGWLLTGVYARNKRSATANLDHFLPWRGYLASRPEFVGCFCPERLKIPQERQQKRGFKDFEVLPIASMSLRQRLLATGKGQAGQ
jgi:hypothetical protein